jgi:hypothetical protein
LRPQINRKNEGLYCRKTKCSTRNRIRFRANTKHDGYYEGNGYALYLWAFVLLKEPNDYKSWKSWDLNNLPMLPDKFETKVENSGIKSSSKS